MEHRKGTRWWRTEWCGERAEEDARRERDNLDLLARHGSVSVCGDGTLVGPLGVLVTREVVESVVAAKAKWLD